MSDEKVFADGFRFTRKEQAPDWVVGKLGVNVESARETFKAHTKNGWLNLEIKRSQNGKYYVEVDTWEPRAQKPEAQEPAVPAQPELDDDIPF